MKYALSFILGAMAVMVLDMVWASKGYAQDDQIRVCRDTSSYPIKIIIVEAGQQCPPGHY